MKAITEVQPSASSVEHDRAWKAWKAAHPNEPPSLKSVFREERIAAYRILRDNEARARIAVGASTGSSQAPTRQAPTAPQAPAVDVSAAIAKALRDDRERILAVLASPEAVGREWAARTLACHCGEPAAEIRKLLATTRLDAEPDPREVDAYVKAIVDQANRRRR